MFCPRCGQQQVVEEVRFCARCGFQLGGVAVLLANEGAWPAHAAPPAAPLDSPRSRGVRQGGMMMLFGAALVPVLAIIGSRTVGVGGEAALLGVILFILGLAPALRGHVPGRLPGRAALAAARAAAARAALPARAGARAASATPGPRARQFQTQGHGRTRRPARERHGEHDPSARQTDGRREPLRRRERRASSDVL